MLDNEGNKYTLPVLNMTNVSTDNAAAKNDNIMKANVVHAANLRLMKLEKIFKLLKIHELPLPENSAGIDDHINQLRQCIESGEKLNKYILTMSTHYTGAEPADHVRLIVHFEKILNQYTGSIKFTNGDAKLLLDKAVSFYNQNAQHIPSMDISSTKYNLLKDIEHLVNKLYINKAFVKRIDRQNDYNLASIPNVVDFLLEIEVAVAELEKLEKLEKSLESTNLSKAQSEKQGNDEAMVTFAYKPESRNSTTMTIRSSGVEATLTDFEEIIVPAPTSSQGLIFDIHAKLAKNANGKEYGAEIYTTTKAKAKDEYCNLAKATIAEAIELGVKQPIAIISGIQELKKAAYMVCIQSNIAFDVPAEGKANYGPYILARYELSQMKPDAQVQYKISNVNELNLDKNIEICKHYTEKNKF